MGGLSKELFRAGAHALSQGALTHLQGGNFWHGATSGGISSLGGSAMTRLGFNDVEMIAGSAALGGIGSEISGGNFWRGFGQGLTVGAFNHALQNELVNRIREKIVLNAEADLGSTKWNFEVSIDDFGENTNKCNKFVYDKLVQSGADPGTPNGFFSDNPPTAGQWADPNFKLKGWKVVSNPRRGDVVAYRYNYSDATGHVAIVGANARAIRYSVGTSGTFNSIAKTEFGFSSSTHYLPQGAKYVYRRYVGQ